MKDKMTITPRAAAVLPIRTELPDESPDCEPCPNCGQVSTVEELQPIDDLHQRVAPGEPMPAGECPDCGALCHLVNPETVSLPVDQAAEIAKLRAALEEIAERGPIEGYTSAGALRLRLVATQCIARAALAVSGIGGPLGVKIEVTGGCAEVTECPESVRVTIIDHDKGWHG